MSDSIKFILHSIKSSKKHISIAALIFAYLVIMISQLDWGIPGNNHPFSYHMDEWGQAQGLKTTFKKGTPHLSGSGNGTVFFYVVSAGFLAPFVVLHIVNPFIIKSSLLFLQEQHRLFEILRLQSIFYGVLSIILVAYLAKRFFKADSFLAACFFAISPLFLMLTLFYRYDTAVVFWILLSLLFLFRYLESPTVKRFFLAGIVSALTVAIKVSAIPLILIYIVSFFLFMPNWRNKMKSLLIGVVIFIIVFIITAIPDALVSFNQFTRWVYISTVSNSINMTSNYVFGMPFRIYFFFFAYPAVFGRVLYSIFVLSLFSLMVLSARYILKKTLPKKSKIELFLLFSYFAFASSIFALGVGGIGNRLLPLLPFMALISCIMLQKLMVWANKKVRFILLFVLTIGIVFQSTESLSWVSTRWYPDPRETSSTWIRENIPKGSKIGIENIPIYQDIPDMILKDFYTTQYFPNNKTIYSYQVIDGKTNAFAPIVIVTNDVAAEKFVKVSEEKIIVAKLKMQGYNKIAEFFPNFSYFSLFNNEKNFYFSGLRATPYPISIWVKGE